MQTWEPNTASRNPSQQTPGPELAEQSAHVEASLSNSVLRGVPGGKSQVNRFTARFLHRNGALAREDPADAISE